MRILVVGGTNFIGPRVVRNLVREGHDVTVYHRGETESKLLADVQHIRSDHASMPVVKFPDAVTDLKPEVVVHMIPMGEADARAAVAAFTGVSQRIVGISSGDVYRAYGVFNGSEPGPVQVMPLTEDSELRTVLYPYRSSVAPQDWKYDYDKILMERTLLCDDKTSATILRLPKVYGPAKGHGLDHLYQAAGHPKWKWTHGFVDNVAHAISLAATHPAAAGQVFNVGEQATPTIEERLSLMPAAPDSHSAIPKNLNFNQSMVLDSSRIREVLGFEEIVPYEEGIALTGGA